MTGQVDGLAVEHGGRRARRGALKLSDLASRQGAEVGGAQPGCGVPGSRGQRQSVEGDRTLLLIDGRQAGPARQREAGSTSRAYSSAGMPSRLSPRWHRSNGAVNRSTTYGRRTGPARGSAGGGHVLSRPGRAEHGLAGALPPLLGSLPDRQHDQRGRVRRQPRAPPAASCHHPGIPLTALTALTAHRPVYPPGRLLPTSAPRPAPNTHQTTTPAGQASHTRPTARPSAARAGQRRAGRAMGPAGPRCRAATRRGRIRDGAAQDLCRTSGRSRRDADLADL